MITIIRYKYQYTTYASTVLPTSDNGLRTPLLFIACADGAVEISSGNPPKKIHTVRIEGMATAVALSPDGLRLAVGSSVGTVTMFLLKTLRLDGVIDCRNRYGKLKDGRKIIGMQWQKDSQRLRGNTIIIINNESIIPE
ncbi:hypothetical protein Pmar_PMAR022485 [Perkinsus marinus ATCC 50983]|uniref:Uncharacterized protein n=1 Tax=Perkinsus marinus (strain ATCC 50983 / TXsc) TaxID=423536 RepID=C5KND7_PERM5|nr:hypothetical protein Pmar_PMAR022485 [Perkinsus marinus ATCC 50983]EER13952.1 hypothetical protein Pmar_PMAR022485 [Perkinsus marinus ATCC 50983]|eukprot:XP_002782157.1 hypothetical protein Pmar_PMAR022485 [Perkinsus marinus ATCC 50983]